MIELTTIPTGSQDQAKCDGGCKGCGKAHIKLLGHDAASLHLRESVEAALLSFPMAYKIIEIAEPNAIAALGATALPAMFLDGQLMVQGRVPSPEEIVEMFRDRYLHRSKLHRLKTVAVAVDISAGADSALRFAWSIAHKVGAELEVIYAMDSIFDGHTPSASGFLSSYQRTMQLELDMFIRETMARMGVLYEAPVPRSPGQAPPQEPPLLRSKVIYGFPDTALEEHSKKVDLLVLGTTGRGTLGKKLFGSVSIEVSKRAHCPVLLVPLEAEFHGFHNMLYASNFESLSNLRIQQAVSFARHFDGQVHFVHVGPGGEKGADLERRLFESSYRESHPDQPFLFAKMVSDDVTGSLYEYSFYHRIDLLVFVTHQRSFWDNILHRSITSEAAVSTDLPMLIIHSDDDML